MSKLNLILASLVAAVPGGILVVLIVLSEMNHFEAMTLVQHIFNGLLAAVSAAALLLPAWVFLFHKEGPLPAKVKKSADEDDDSDADEDEEELAPSASSQDDDEDVFDDDDDDEMEFGDDDDEFDDFEDDDDDWE